MNIVIVGGGTAGWICAFLLSYWSKKHNITLIASSEIETIGVGESTTGLFTSLVAADYGNDIIEFLRETDSTIKTGVLLKHWDKNKQSYFSPLDGSVTADLPIDYSFYYAINQGYSRSNCNFWSIISENKKTNLNKNTLKFDSDVYPALHIDTYKTANYLKDKSTKQGVKYIDSKVEDILLDENGFIKELILSGDSRIKADFFIDATGFSRKLISKVGSFLVSYKENLPVNRAIIFNLEKDLNDEEHPITLSHALSSGWMWKIPTRNRYGMGYVYCDAYLSDDEALLEVQNIIGKKISKYRFISFESGRLDKMWNKNCLAIGVGASFLEPLQATSIHTTILQINDFIKNHLMDTFSQTYSEYSERMYNKNMNFLVDQFKNFISVHYAGGRNDFPFWKEINLTEEAKTIIGLAKHRLIYRSDFRMDYGIDGATSYELCSYILDGVGALTKQKTQELFDSNPEMYKKGKEFYHGFYDHVVGLLPNFFSPKELDSYLFAN